MKKKLDISVFRALLLLLYSLILAVFSTDVSYITMCWLSIIDIVLVLIYIRHKGIKIYDARLLFLFILILYTISQNLVYPFISGSTEYKTVLFTRLSYSDSLMNRASVCTLMCINVLTIVLFSGDRGNNKQGSYIFELDEERIHTIKFFSTILFVISVPFMLYKMLIYLQFFMANGYGDSAKSLLPSYVKLISPYFFTSIAIGTTINLYQKKKNIFYDIFIIIFVLYSFIIGDRGGGICFALFRVWEWFLFRDRMEMGDGIKRMSIKKTITIIIGGIVFLMVMQVVKTYRGMYSENILGVFSVAFSTLGSSNFIVEDILEFGGSMYSLIETIKRFDSGMLSHAYGLQYLDFFISMIPSFFGVSTIYPHLASWLTGSSGFAGQGFSIIAEAYYNFSSFAWLAMIPIGKVVRKFYYYDGEQSRNKTIYNVLFAALCMSFMGDIARRSISQFGFTCLWYILIPVLVCKYAHIRG